MRKRTILPVIALGALTLGTISTALPAGAAMQFGEDGNDGTTTPTNGTGSGSGATPSGGAATGGGGMADGSTSNANAALWLAAGGAGLALIGTGAIARRRRLHPAMSTSSSSTSGTNL